MLYGSKGGRDCHFNAFLQRYCKAPWRKTLKWQSLPPYCDKAFQFNLKKKNLSLRFLSSKGDYNNVRWVALTFHYLHFLVDFRRNYCGGIEAPQPFTFNSILQTLNSLVGSETLFFLNYSCWFLVGWIVGEVFLL